MRALLREWNDIVGQLRRTSNGAEQSGQLTAVAALAGQRYRGLEFAARLANLPGFAPPTHPAVPGGASKFIIEMVFPHAQEQHLTINGEFAGDDTDLANPPAPAGRPDHLIIEGESGADEGPPED